jgi:hypothetical protein
MNDDEALKLCLDTLLANPDKEGREKQLRDYLAEGNQADAAKLACSVLQRKALGVPPWVTVPSDGILEDDDPKTVRLIRHMQKQISLYHPDPLRALREAGA